MNVRKNAILMVAMVLTASPALAGHDRVPPVRDPVVLRECGSCHMAFQPDFLPARSWERIMDGLADHFGEDASLPADVKGAIRAYLAANAGGAAGWRARGEATPERITGTPAFMREHRFPERVWRDPKVLTKSNCPACHSAAEKGLYDDH
ncbi:MAG: diheme cytochrome c [Alphaproteobacteria bacterium]|nr:diheme cytochrome c [Alphaproteobacteria bacterium]